MASDCRIGLVFGSNEAPPNRGRAGLKGRLWHLFSRLMSQELALCRPFMLERASATQLSESGHVAPHPLELVPTVVKSQKKTMVAKGRGPPCPRTSLSHPVGLDIM